MYQWIWCNISINLRIPSGAFTGLSSLSIALVLPEGGKVCALDISREYMEIGKPFFKKVRWSFGFGIAK